MSYDGNGKIAVTPKKKSDGNYYISSDGKSPIVLGGLVLDVEDEDFSSVTRLQMSQENGFVPGLNNKKLFSYTYPYMVNNGTVGNVEQYWESQYDANYTPVQNLSNQAHALEWVSDYPFGIDGVSTYLPETFTGQTMTMKTFLITYDVIRAEPKQETSLRDYAYNTWSSADASGTVTGSTRFAFATGIEITPGALVYGDLNNNYLSYADISGAQSIRIYATAGMRFGLKFNRQSDGSMIDIPITTSQEPDASYSNFTDKPGTYKLYALDLSTVQALKSAGYTHLNTIVNGYSSIAGVVDNITFYDSDAPIDYYVSGKIHKNNTPNSSITYALSDRLAMNIDATKLRNSSANAVSLVSANLNCLYYTTDAAKIAESRATGEKKNLVVRSGSAGSYTYSISDLYLSDARQLKVAKGGLTADYYYPFRSPYDINLSGGVFYSMYIDRWGTLCLPYSIGVPSGLTAYKLTGTFSWVDGRRYVDVTPVTTIEANVPVIVKSNDGSVKTDQWFAQLNYSTTVKKTPDTMSEGGLSGTFLKQASPVGSYVLQDLNDGDGMAFHPVVEGQQPTLYQFRGYFAPPVAQAGAKAFLLRVVPNEATDIDNMDITATPATIVARYNATGERIDMPQKGLNILKMSDGTIRKTFIH